MYVIYMHLCMLTDQTGLPPNQPTSLKAKNVHNLGIFQPIQLNFAFGMQSVNGGTHYLGIFPPIWLKLGMQSLNGRTPHMYVISRDFSTLIQLTTFDSAIQ